MLISEKIEFKTKILLEIKEEHCVMIKGSKHQEPIKIINTQAHITE